MAWEEVQELVGSGAVTVAETVSLFNEVCAPSSDVLTYDEFRRVVDAMAAAAAAGPRSSGEEQSEDTDMRSKFAELSGGANRLLPIEAFLAWSEVTDVIEYAESANCGAVGGLNAIGRICLAASDGQGDVLSFSGFDRVVTALGDIGRLIDTAFGRRPGLANEGATTDSRPPMDSRTARALSVAAEWAHSHPEHLSADEHAMLASGGILAERAALLAAVAAAESLMAPNDEPTTPRQVMTDEQTQSMVELLRGDVRFLLERVATLQRSVAKATQAASIDRPPWEPGQVSRLASSHRHPSPLTSLPTIPTAPPRPAHEARFGAHPLHGARPPARRDRRWSHPGGRRRRRLHLALATQERRLLVPRRHGVCAQRVGPVPCGLHAHVAQR